MLPTTRILIFAKYPVPGEAKTRLIPGIGSERAAQLHRRMTEHAVGIARRAAAGKEDTVGITVCHTGARRKDFQAWLGADLHYERQSSGHLGVRLQQAFAHAFDSGAARVLAIGADIPGLTPEILHQALRQLSDGDIVLGPAADGGYYLIGMNKVHPELFADMDWGTERVLTRTRDAIAGSGLRAGSLPTLNDIDRPEDLPMLRDDPCFADLFIAKPLISVIIPTLNEAVVIERTLQCVRKAEGIEITVVDGGSHDATCAVAATAGATVLSVAGGRAAQMNAGAMGAKGRMLLFLHADTRVPDGYADLIREALDDPAVVAGAFRFRTDRDGAAMRLIERTVDFRSTRLQWPYGDQGLFLEKRVFAEMGGFASMPVMEDFDLVRRLRRRGRIVTLREAAVTSARRWEKLGIIRTTIMNQIMIAGFLMGIPADVLKRFYRRRADDIAHSGNANTVE